MNDLLFMLGEIALILLLFVLALRWYEPRLIYYPALPTRAIVRTPDHAGLPFEDVYLTTADGVRLHGWFLPADGAVTALAEGAGIPSSSERWTVLFFHGNSGNISHRYDKLAVLRALGLDVFIIDYRGYGRSEGRPHEAGTYQDAEAAYQYLTGQRRLDPRSVVVYGESLGSAVAIDLAARVAVAALVIEAAFASALEVGQKMLPFLPVRLLMRNKYDSISKIGGVSAPVLILHSHDDEYFPMHHAQRLLAATTAPRQLVELRGGHNDAFQVSAAEHSAALRRFFEGLARR